MHTITRYWWLASITVPNKKRWRKYLDHPEPNSQEWDERLKGLLPHKLSPSTCDIIICLEVSLSSLRTRRGTWLFQHLYSVFHQHSPRGNSLAIRWLGLHALTAKGPGSIPGQGTKIPQACKLCGAAKKQTNKRPQNIHREPGTALGNKMGAPKWKYPLKMCELYCNPDLN